MQVRCVAWSPFGILTGSRDKTIRIWKEDAGGKVTCVNVLVSLVVRFSSLLGHEGNSMQVWLPLDSAGSG